MDILCYAKQTQMLVHMYVAKALRGHVHSSCRHGLHELRVTNNLSAEAVLWTVFRAANIVNGQRSVVLRGEAFVEQDGLELFGSCLGLCRILSEAVGMNVGA
jgi:hypothetical protein